MNRITQHSNGISNGRPFRARDEQAAKRERILAAALKLFAHEPYQAVTMDRVAEAAGVAKGTLYLYFPSKDALYLGVLSDGLDTAYRTYQSSADPKLPVVERLRRSIAVVVEFFDRRRDFLRFFAIEEPRLAEARNQISTLNAEVTDLRSDSQGQASAQGEWAGRLAQSLDETAARIERLAQDLNNIGR